MAMDGDVLAQIDELAVRSSRSAAPKASDPRSPGFALRAKSLQLRTPMIVSDVENGARICALPPNSATTRLGTKNIPVDKGCETEVKVIVRNITQYHSQFEVESSTS